MVAQFYTCLVVKKYKHTTINITLYLDVEAGVGRSAICELPGLVEAGLSVIGRHVLTSGVDVCGS